MRLTIKVTVGVFAATVVAGYLQSQSGSKPFTLDEAHMSRISSDVRAKEHTPLEDPNLEYTTATLYTSDLAQTDDNESHSPALKEREIQCTNGDWGCDNESIPARSWVCVLNQPRYNNCTINQYCTALVPNGGPSSVHYCKDKPLCTDGKKICYKDNVSPNYTTCINGKLVKSTCSTGVCQQIGDDIRCKFQKTRKQASPTYQVKTKGFVTSYGPPVTVTLPATVETVAYTATYPYTDTYITAETYQAIETWEVIETFQEVLTNVYTNVVLITDGPIPTTSTMVLTSLKTREHDNTYFHTGEHTSTSIKVATSVFNSAKLITTTFKTAEVTVIHKPTKTYRLSNSHKYSVTHKGTKSTGTVKSADTDQPSDYHKSNDSRKHTKTHKSTPTDSHNHSGSHRYTESHKPTETHKSVHSTDSYKSTHSSDSQKLSDSHKPSETHKSVHSTDSHKPANSHKDTETHKSTPSTGSHNRSDSHKDTESHKPSDTHKSDHSTDSRKPADSHKDTETHKPTPSTDSHKRSDNHKDTESHKPYKSFHSTNSRKPADSSKDTETYKSTPPTDSHKRSDSQKDTESHKPTETHKSVHSTDSYKPTHSSDSQKLSDSYKPSETHKSVHSTDSRKPVDSHKDTESHTLSEIHKFVHSTDLRKPADSHKDTETHKSTPSTDSHNRSDSHKDTETLKSTTSTDSHKHSVSHKDTESHKPSETHKSVHLTDSHKPADSKYTETYQPTRSTDSHTNSYKSINSHKLTETDWSVHSTASHKPRDSHKNTESHKHAETPKPTESHKHTQTHKSTHSIDSHKRGGSHKDTGSLKLTSHTTEATTTTAIDRFKTIVIHERSLSHDSVTATSDENTITHQPIESTGDATKSTNTMQTGISKIKGSSYTSQESHEETNSSKLTGTTDRTVAETPTSNVTTSINKTNVVSESYQSSIHDAIHTVIETFNITETTWPTASTKTSDTKTIIDNNKTGQIRSDSQVSVTHQPSHDMVTNFVNSTHKKAGESNVHSRTRSTSMYNINSTTAKTDDITVTVWKTMPAKISTTPSNSYSDRTKSIETEVHSAKFTSGHSKEGESSVYFRTTVAVVSYPTLTHNIKYTVTKTDIKTDDVTDTIWKTMSGKMPISPPDSSSDSAKSVETVAPSAKATSGHERSVEPSGYFRSAASHSTMIHVISSTHNKIGKSIMHPANSAETVSHPISTNDINNTVIKTNTKTDDTTETIWKTISARIPDSSPGSANSMETTVPSIKPTSDHEKATESSVHSHSRVETISYPTSAHDITSITTKTVTKKDDATKTVWMTMSGNIPASPSDSSSGNAKSIETVVPSAKASRDHEKSSESNVHSYSIVKTVLHPTSTHDLHITETVWRIMSSNIPASPSDSSSGNAKSVETVTPSAIATSAPQISGESEIRSGSTLEIVSHPTSTHDINSATTKIDIQTDDVTQTIWKTISSKIPATLSNSSVSAKSIETVVRSAKSISGPEKTGVLSGSTVETVSHPISAHDIDSTAAKIDIKTDDVTETVWKTISGEMPATPSDSSDSAKSVETVIRSAKATSGPERSSESGVHSDSTIDTMSYPTSTHDINRTAVKVVIKTDDVTETIWKTVPSKIPGTPSDVSLDMPKSVETAVGSIKAISGHEKSGGSGVHSYSVIETVLYPTSAHDINRTANKIDIKTDDITETTWKTTSAKILATTSDSLLDKERSTETLVPITETTSSSNKVGEPSGYPYGIGTTALFLTSTPLRSASNAPDISVDNVKPSETKIHITKISVKYNTGDSPSLVNQEITEPAFNTDTLAATATVDVYKTVTVPHQVTTVVVSGAPMAHKSEISTSHTLQSNDRVVRGVTGIANIHKTVEINVSETAKIPQPSIRGETSKAYVVPETVSAMNTASGIEYGSEEITAAYVPTARIITIDTTIETLVPTDTAIADKYETVEVEQTYLPSKDETSTVTETSDTVLPTMYETIFVTIEVPASEEINGPHRSTTRVSDISSHESHKESETIVAQASVKAHKPALTSTPKINSISDTTTHSIFECAPSTVAISSVTVTVTATPTTVTVASVTVTVTAAPTTVTEPITSQTPHPTEDACVDGAYQCAESGVSQEFTICSNGKLYQNRCAVGTVCKTIENSIICDWV